MTWLIFEVDNALYASLPRFHYASRLLHRSLPLLETTGKMEDREHLCDLFYLILGCDYPIRKIFQIFYIRKMMVTMVMIEPSMIVLLEVMMEMLLNLVLTNPNED